jgi:predicted regulator of Ras-like GTPase activity (Roadblock/LC7/MglB family)
VTGAEASVLSEGVRATLVTLKDLVGIAGSFVCTQNGRLVAREIPALFEDAVLAEAGSRLVRVGETFAAGGDDLEAAVIRYGDHRLYLKVVTGGMLCIVIVGDVNMPALRMAANLVGRRIAPAVAKAQEETSAMPPTEPNARATPVVPREVVKAARQATSSAPPQAPPGMRRFRGREVS